MRPKISLRIDARTRSELTTYLFDFDRRSFGFLCVPLSCILLLETLTNAQTVYQTLPPFDDLLLPLRLSFLFSVSLGRPICLHKVNCSQYRPLPLSTVQTAE